MLLIGERINATRKPVAKAFGERDESFFIKEARLQAEAGSDFIDINCGVGSNEKELMVWLAPILNSSVDVPFFFDSANAEVIEAGLSTVKNPLQHVANSVILDEGRLSVFLPVVREYGCGIVGLLMDENGIPDTVEKRVAIAKKLLNRFEAKGIAREKIFFDPMVESIAVDGSKALFAVRCIRELKPVIAPAKILVSVSGVSFGLPKRSVLNRTFLPMVADAGADAVIADPLDNELMATLFATNALLGSDPYCLKYIQAYRKGKL